MTPSCTRTPALCRELPACHLPLGLGASPPAWRRGQRPNWLQNATQRPPAPRPQAGAQAASSEPEVLRRGKARIASRIGRRGGGPGTARRRAETSGRAGFSQGSREAHTAVALGAVPPRSRGPALARPTHTRWPRSGRGLASSEPVPAAVAASPCRRRDRPSAGDVRDGPSTPSTSRVSQQENLRHAQ